jgi:CheY-like chemotaxis protein
MPHILIVDDQSAVRTALRRYFEESNLAHCSEAADGQQALQKAQQEKPDLVILDFSMPVMNGIEAARALRQTMPEVPIFMLTAYFGEVDQMAKELEVCDVFSKENVAPLIKRARTVLNRNAATNHVQPCEPCG